MPNFEHIEITSGFNGEKWAGAIDLDSLVGRPTANMSDEEKLEWVFRFFNRVTDQDTDRLAKWGYRLPSMSAGDRVVLNGQAWLVKSVGFVREA